MHVDGRMSALTLSFASVELERAFLEAYRRDTLPLLRFAIYAGLVLYMVFGTLDALVAGDAAGRLWTIRYGVVCPAVVLLSTVTWTRWAAALSQVVGGASLALASLGIVAMTTVAEPPAAWGYYSGLMLTMIYGYSLLPLRFSIAAALSLTATVAYLAVAAFITHVPGAVLANNLFFLIAANVLGMFSSYSLELYRRRDFLQLRLNLQDRTKLEAANRALREMATRDPLTGLLNRRYLEERLRETLQRFRRDKTPATLMLLDLDDFKGLNDRLGHVAGDTVLRRVADRISGQVRGTDLVFRYGGDEFLVLFAGTALAQAGGVAERILSAVRSVEVESDDPVRNVVRVSAGLTPIDETTESVEAVMLRVDETLYKAKEQGKDRIVV